MKSLETESALARVTAKKKDSLESVNVPETSPITFPDVRQRKMKSIGF